MEWHFDGDDVFGSVRGQNQRRQLSNPNMTISLHTRRRKYNDIKLQKKPNCSDTKENNMKNGHLFFLSSWRLHTTMSWTVLFHWLNAMTLQPKREREHKWCWKANCFNDSIHRHSLSVISHWFIHTRVLKKKTQISMPMRFIVSVWKRAKREKNHEEYNFLIVYRTRKITSFKLMPNFAAVFRSFSFRRIESYLNESKWREKNKRLPNIKKSHKNCYRSCKVWRWQDFYNGAIAELWIARNENSYF